MDEGLHSEGCEGLCDNLDNEKTLPVPYLLLVLGDRHRLGDVIIPILILI